jgi:hypothetical protein
VHSAAAPKVVTRARKTDVDYGWPDRKYLGPAEVEAPIRAAKDGRHAARDALMIGLAYPMGRAWASLSGWSGTVPALDEILDEMGMMSRPPPPAARLRTPLRRRLQEATADAAKTWVTVNRCMRERRPPRSRYLRSPGREAAGQNARVRL